MINSGMIGSQIANICHILATGQETSYHADDDGGLELGIGHDFEVLSTGQYSGTTNIVINGKTHALSNNCVRDNAVRQNGQPLMWARYVPTADIGPAADGKLFGGQYMLGPKTDISFDAASKEIRSAAAEFSTGALCAGRKVTVSGAGQAGNNQIVTVVGVTTSVCVVSETVVNEAAGASISLATVDDLIWDFVDRANANSLGGYTDWRVPNINELSVLVKYCGSSPLLDLAAFPSDPASNTGTSTSYPVHHVYIYVINFSTGRNSTVEKAKIKFYCRLVRS